MRNTLKCALALTASAALLMTGCQKIKTITSGLSIKFSAGITNDKATRVNYGASTSEEQTIEWAVGDLITIYCAQCSNKQVSEYKVSEVSPDSKGNNYARIANNPDEMAEGLRWSEEEVTHYFYAVYPGVSTSGTTTTINGNIITGNIPSSQGFGTITGEASKVVPPDMKNLYLVAEASLETGASTDVFLNFQALTTVLDFTITNKFEDTKSTMNVKSISLISANHALSGGFKADMDKDGLYGRPKTDLEDDIVIADNNKVTIDFGSNPVSIPYGENLNFIFFLNPGNTVDDLTFEINAINAGSGEEFDRRAAMNKKDGTGVSFSTHKKTNITGIMIPESVGWEIEGDVVVVPWNEETESEPEFKREDSLSPVTVSPLTEESEKNITFE